MSTAWSQALGCRDVWRSAKVEKMLLVSCDVVVLLVFKTKLYQRRHHRFVRPQHERRHHQHFITSSSVGNNNATPSTHSTTESSTSLTLAPQFSQRLCRLLCQTQNHALRWLFKTTAHALAHIHICAFVAAGAV